MSKDNNDIKAILKEAQAELQARQLRYYKMAFCYLTTQNMIRHSEAVDKLKGLKHPSALTKRLKREEKLLRKETSSLRAMITP